MSLLDPVRRIGRPYRHLIIRRRLHAFGVGLGKSGTTSLARIFAHYRVAHEARPRETIEHILAHSSGTLTDTEMVKYLRKRDRDLWLEFEASQILADVVDRLYEAFPAARFILTVRHPRTWLRSTINHEETQRIRPWWRDLANARFGEPTIGDRTFFPLDLGYYTLSGYLSFWARHHRRVLDTIPPTQLLVVETAAISSSLGSIGEFVGVPPETLDLSAAHSRKAAPYSDPLARFDPHAVEEEIRHLCGDLIAELLERT